MIWSWGPGHHTGSNYGTFFRFMTYEPLLVPYLDVIPLYLVRGKPARHSHQTPGGQPARVTFFQVIVSVIDIGRPLRFVTRKLHVCPPGEAGVVMALQ